MLAYVVLRGGGNRNTRKNFCFNTIASTESYEPRCKKKPAFWICENKDADQLRGNSEADQRLCFRYTDSTIHLLSESEISSF